MNKGFKKTGLYLAILMMAVSSCTNLGSSVITANNDSSIESVYSSELMIDSNEISAQDSSTISSNDNSNNKKVYFNDYVNLMKLDYTSEILKADDVGTGIIFKTAGEFDTYFSSFKNLSFYNNDAFDDFINHLDISRFDNYYLYVTAQITLPDSGFDFGLNNMFILNEGLNVVVDRTSNGGGYQFLRWGVYAFFINKSISFNKFTTIINKTDGFNNV